MAVITMDTSQKTPDFRGDLLARKINNQQVQDSIKTATDTIEDVTDARKTQLLAKVNADTTSSKELLRSMAANPEDALALDESGVFDSEDSMREAGILVGDADTAKIQEFGKGRAAALDTAIRAKEALADNKAKRDSEGAIQNLIRSIDPLSNETETMGKYDKIAKQHKFSNRLGGLRDLFQTQMRQRMALNPQNQEKLNTAIASDAASVATQKQLLQSEYNQWASQMPALSDRERYAENPENANAFNNWVEKNVNEDDSVIDPLLNWFSTPLGSEAVSGPLAKERIKEEWAKINDDYRAELLKTNKKQIKAMEESGNYTKEQIEDYTLTPEKLKLKFLPPTVMQNAANNFQVQEALFSNNKDVIIEQVIKAMKEEQLRYGRYDMSNRMLNQRKNDLARELSNLDASHVTFSTDATKRMKSTQAAARLLALGAQ